MAIEIRDAVKKYGRGESEICALDHVNLRIEKGEAGTVWVFTIPTVSNWRH